MIRIGSIKDWSNVSGTRIAVCHLRGYKKENFDYVMPELSPPQGLLRNLKLGDIDKRTFIRRYVNSLFNEKAIEALKQIKRMTNDVYLLAYEDDQGFNHTKMLKIILETFNFPFDYRCKFLISNDARLRCLVKEGIPQFFEIPTRSPNLTVTVERNFVYDPLVCNFALQSPEPGVVRGAKFLRECLIYKKKTHLYTCGTCFFFRKEYSPFCLKRKVPVTKNGLCDYYITKDLKHGDNLQIFKLRYLIYFYSLSMSQIYDVLLERKVKYKFRKKS
jgi:uncharacterized protein YeaO (DUF488 family)